MCFDLCFQRKKASYIKLKSIYLYLEHVNFYKKKIKNNDYKDLAY